MANKIKEHKVGGCFLAKARASLRFLNLLDHSQQHLSITNLCVYVALVKIALMTSTSPTDLGALFVSLASYAHKRHTNDKAEQGNES